MVACSNVITRNSVYYLLTFVPTVGPDGSSGARVHCVVRASSHRHFEQGWVRALNNSGCLPAGHAVDTDRETMSALVERIGRRATALDQASVQRLLPVDAELRNIAVPVVDA